MGTKLEVSDKMPPLASSMWITEDIEYYNVLLFSIVLLVFGCRIMARGSLPVAEMLQMS